MIKWHAQSGWDIRERSKIEKVSHEGDPKAISFPPKIADGVYDFSFSGLKSAVLNYLNGCRMKNLPINQADVGASFQQSVTDVLVDHARHAIREYHMEYGEISKWS